MKQQVTGMIIGSALLAQGITVDKDGDPIEAGRFYSYITEHCGFDAFTVVSKTNVRERIPGPTRTIK